MFDIFERWLRLGAARLHDAAADLTALDQAIGDGDHGINMDRGFTAIVAQLDAGRPDADGDRALTGTAAKAAGRTLISTVGGAAGPLYGTAFIRGGTSILTAEAGSPAGQRRGGRHRGRHHRDRRSRQGDDRREDDARRPGAGPRGRRGRGAGGRRHRRRRAGHGGRGRGRCGRHGARCSRPRVARRISASGASATRTRAPRPPRCSCAPWPMPSPRADGRESGQMLVTRAVLSGRIGSPGVGVGRILRVELPAEAPDDRRARRAAERRTGAAIGGARGGGR